MVVFNEQEQQRYSLKILVAKIHRIKLSMPSETFSMTKQQLSIPIKAVIYGILFLVIGLLFCLMVGYYMELLSINGGDNVVVFLGMFVVWLVHGSVLRTIFRLDKGAGFWTLMVSGVLVLAGSIVLSEVIKYVIGHFTTYPLLITIEELGWQEYVALFIIAILLTLVTIINLRIKNRFWGNVLEIVLIIILLIVFSFV